MGKFSATRLLVAVAIVVSAVRGSHNSAKGKGGSYSNFNSKCDGFISGSGSINEGEGVCMDGGYYGTFPSSFTT
jgi:hypothetical protein